MKKVYCAIVLIVGCMPLHAVMRRPTSASGYTLSKQLVAALHIARQATRRIVHVPVSLSTLENARVVDSATAQGLTIVLLQAHGRLDVPGWGEVEMHSQEDEVPVVVAYNGDTPVWVTSGQPAHFVAHNPVCCLEDGSLMLMVWVQCLPDQALYTFGTEKVIIPQSDCNGLMVLIKIDAANGTVRALETHPVQKPKPPFVQ